ncbi:putative transcriptional regulator, cyclic nucleotide binding protein [Bacillus freudenreichii]|nr:putative transcriptional regulator, cyclic nucleotide binding protein [Bacillus freudenreichii]
MIAPTLTNSSLETWEDFLTHGKRMFFKAKTIIFRQGDTCPGFYYIKRGIVKVYSMKPDINERILDISGPGILIGEHTIDYLPCYSTAIAHEDCILYYFTKKDYENLSLENPEVTLLFAKSLIDKKRVLLNNINATNASTEYQIARSLLYLMNSYQSMEINLTQQELSHYVGLTRITVYKVLKRWIDEGLVAIKNRKIFILDSNALEEFLFS